ncbi:hypothetical protein [Streptomyces malaysiensis]|uniref:hypothetical protein n=1 Tax=Streptomyces malaysiensis TaxID=92644 RepID=UPI0036B459B5
MAETTYYDIEVEAEDSDQASEVAEEMYCASYDPDTEYGANKRDRNVESVTVLHEADAHAV